MKQRLAALGRAVWRRVRWALLIGVIAFALQLVPLAFPDSDFAEIYQLVLVYLLATAWIPTVIGVTYLIWIYWRSSRNWLILTMLLISIDVTIAVLYISYASSVRLLGLPPLQYGPLIGGTVALLLAAIVPYLAFRVWWTLHGGPHPTLPTPEDTTPAGKEHLG